MKYWPIAKLRGDLVLDVLLTAPLFRATRRLLRRPGTLERTAEVRLLG